MGCSESKPAEAVVASKQPATPSTPASATPASSADNKSASRKSEPKALTPAKRASSKKIKSVKAEPKLPNSVVGKLFAKHTVRDAIAAQLKPGALVVGFVDEDLATIAARLAKHNFSSLPIFHRAVGEDAADNGQGTYAGLLDFSDIVQYLLSVTSSANRQPRESTSSHASMSSRRGYTPLSLADSSVGTWSTVVTTARVDAVLADSIRVTPKIKLSAPLSEAVQRLGHDDKPRRLVVVDDKDQVVAVFGSKAPVEFVTSKMPTIWASSDGLGGELFDEPCEGLDLGSSPVRSVSKSHTMLDAFSDMFEAHHSVMPVVDGSGALVGSVSMSDVKRLFITHQYQLLNQTCWAFILSEREKSMEENFPFFAVDGRAKLRTVIGKLLATKVHHLFVVDEGTKPDRVISFSDVCTTLHEH